MPKNNGGKPGGGGDGPLSLDGNRKGNILIGGAFDDNIWGRDGNDKLYGRGGNDLIVGGNGDDILYGEDGNDRLHGSDGNDTLYGGAGSDHLQGGADADIMDGGPGPDDAGGAESVDDHDIASFVEIAPTGDPGTGLFTVGLTIGLSDDTNFDYQTSAGDHIVNVEEIIATNYNDTMIGTAGDDYYVGARGEDTISGKAGNDTLYGSLDDDVIDAGENDGTGIDTLIFLRYGTDGDDTTSDPGALGDGHDTVIGFDVDSDRILFIGNEDFEPTSAMITAFDENDVTGTLITYASNSSILLEDVDFISEADQIKFEWEYVDV